MGNVAVVIWLTHIILSQAGHRLNRVQVWASKRLETLKAFFGEELQELVQFGVNKQTIIVGE